MDGPVPSTNDSAEVTSRAPVDPHSNATQQLTADEIRQIVDQHRQWLLSNEKEGQRAVFIGKDLSPHREILQDADLTDAWLARANFTGMILTGTKFIRCKMEQADLTRADAFMADFTGANLANATLAGTNCARATFRDATLLEVNLEGAVLDAADFTHANLRRSIFRRASLTDAVLSRADLSGRPLTGDAQMSQRIGRAIAIELGWSAPPFVLDSCECIGTRFAPYIHDHWSILRRNYTGSRYAILVAFTVLAFLPLVAQALLWSTVGKLEKPFHDVMHADRTEKFSQFSQSHLRALLVRLRREVDDRNELPESLQRDIDQYLASSAATDEFQSENVAGGHNEAARAGTRFTSRSVAAILMGYGQGAWSLLFAVLVLIYHVVRATLTFFVAALRDEEERTGVSPAVARYSKWWTAHLVTVYLTPLAYGLLLWRVVSVLSTTVYVPL